MELKPAIILNRVVFPQPEGPRRVKNSPCFISRDKLYCCALSLETSMYENADTEKREKLIGDLKKEDIKFIATGHGECIAIMSKN